MIDKNSNENTKVIISPGYLEVILITIIVIACGLWIYDQYFSTKITIVDISSFYNKQKELIREQKITEDEWRANLDNFDIALKSLPKNNVVISKEVILKNGNSYEMPIN